MKSAMRYIAEKLGDERSVCVIGRLDEAKVRYFERWDGAGGTRHVPRPDTLYGMTAEELAALPAEETPCNVFCYMPAEHPGNGNLIYLLPGADLKEAVGVIGEVLKRLRGFDALMEELMRLSVRKMCIHEMTDCISRRMHLNVGVMDISFRWIALERLPGSVPAHTDPSVETNETAFLSEELLTQIEEYARRTHVQMDTPYTLVSAGDLPASMKFPDLFVSALQIPVRSGDHTIAILSLSAPDRELDFLDADMHQETAYLFSLILIRDHLVSPNPYEPCSIILHDIMTSSLADERIIRIRLHTLKWRVPEELYVAVLCPLQMQPEHSMAYLQKMRSELTEILPEAISDIYQDHLYFLIGIKSGAEDSMPAFPGRLKPFLKLNQAMMGISAMFHSVSDLRRHYEEACNAVRVGCRIDPGGEIYFYTSYIAELSVHALSSAAEPESFCHPVIRRLYESSRPADHDLLDTLEQYLFCMKDTGRVCEALHIHRSTLFYRLNKLKDLLGEDVFSDGRCVQQLMYSFTVLHYLEEGNSEEGKDGVNSK